MQRQLTRVDHVLSTIDTAMRELSQRTSAMSGERPSPAAGHKDAELNDSERKHAGGLMRINHTGEVCAQALYRGQALVAKSEKTREALLQAAQEEKDHLDWCEERIDELGAHTSRLNPLFFASSYILGAITAHLKEHLQKLPADDRKSQLVLQQMLVEEERHGEHALEHGGEEFPRGIKRVMRASSQLMTKTTYWL
jgi:ubiquinone biosynthesis monooxygenase Coq7